MLNFIQMKNDNTILSIHQEDTPNGTNSGSIHKWLDWLKQY